MASLVLTGDTSGQVTIAAPAVAGTNTLTLQAATATNAVNTLATAVASTSGASIDFTGLPSWIKRITVMFAGVSLSGTSAIRIQLGTGVTPTYTTSGYIGGVTRTGFSADLTGTTFSNGFDFLSNLNATTTSSGLLTVANVTTNTWSASGTLGLVTGNGTATSLGGYVSLAAVLTAVRITTVNGTDTFDAGTINLLYEG